MINLEIIYSNLLNNIKTIRNHFHDKKVYAVVKSNAYNHGLKEVIPMMIREGIKDYCVSSIEEAIELRCINENIKILLLGRLNKNDIELYKHNNIIVSLSNTNDYEFIHNYKLQYQLCVNTGMNRYGLSIEESKNILSNKSDLLVGIYTHLGSSDVRDKRYYRQNMIFRNLLNDYNLDELDIHISNSSDSLNEINSYNSVRIGMLFYNGIENNLKLLNTINISGIITEIRDVKVGEQVGYHKVKKLNNDKRIGIVNIGYETGILNIFNIKYVEINDKTYRVIGKLCMNNMFVILDESVNIGDMVNVIGKLNSIKSISKNTGISAYEILLNFKSKK